MEIHIEEVIELLENYQKLKEKTKEIKDPEALRINDDYRNLINIGYKLKDYILDGGEILKIYGYIKEKTLLECGGKLESLLAGVIIDLENLTRDKKGTIIDEINRLIDEYK